MVKWLALVMAAIGLAACGGPKQELPSAQFVSPDEGPGPNYVIGPLDTVTIFVWRQPELTTNVTVRPDGRLTVPLIDDIPATGKTPTELAEAIKLELQTYIQDPVVNVIVTGFTGPFASQVRVIGAAANPQAIPFRANMTVLDALIQVGGLSEFAAADRASLVRFEAGTQQQYRLRLGSLLNGGDISANVALQPGDVIIIPESFF